MTADTLIVDAGEAARLLKISKRHFLNLVERRQLPAPIRLGRSTRWLRSSLERVLAEMAVAAGGGK